MPLTVWTNADLTAEGEALIRAAISPSILLRASHASALSSISGSDSACRNADIAFGQPSVEDVLESTSLKWIQLTSAGYTRYDSDEVRRVLRGRRAAMTNSSSVFDDPCAQQVLAFMLCHNRCFQAEFTAFTAGRWSHAEMRPTQCVLTGQSALIVGYGAIGRRLTEFLLPFGMKLKAIRRTVQGTEPIPTFPMAELTEHLPGADHIINLLPSSPNTVGLFSTEQFALMKECAAFYNVGRGDTVDQLALIATLSGGHLGGAYLDVTTPEPLPEDHPLWKAPRCFITPHVAGGMQGEDARMMDHFVANFRRLNAGTELADRIV